MVRVFRTIPAQSIRLLVFDLDGTLIDSVDDLCASVNAMLRHFGRPALPSRVIAGYVGDGASLLVRRALGDPSDELFVESALGYFLDYYREHKLDHTRIYPGVFPALDALLRRPDGTARSMAVLTNKPIVPSIAICEALDLSRYLFRIYGGNSFSSKKPDPEGLYALIQEAGVTPAETIMVGDTPVDTLTARNAGAWSIGCSYGLAPLTLESPLPDCIVDSPSEWPKALGAGGSPPMSSEIVEPLTE
jgi:phosphoglycolate phosphatase